MSEENLSNWEESYISDHFELWIGGTPSRSNETYWDKEKQTDNKWVSIKDINHRYISETEERISDLGVTKSNVKLIPKDTVIMSFKLTIGRLTITKCPLYTNEAIVSFIPKTPNSVDTDYLYYGLQSWNLVSEVDQAVKGATLNKDKMSPRPPEPSWLICSASTSLFTPGRTMKEPTRYTKINPSVTPSFWRSSSCLQMSPIFWKNLIFRNGQWWNICLPLLQSRPWPTC